MQRQVRYVNSADGTRIAYSTYGERLGTTPLLQFGNWFVTDGMSVRMSTLRPWYEELSKHWTMVTYDHRGIGDSQRDVDDVGIESQIIDLEAVIASAGLERFHLMGHGHGGTVAVTYAACHPERIDRLILTNTAPRSEAIFDPKVAQAFLKLGRTGP